MSPVGNAQGALVGPPVRPTGNIYSPLDAEEAGGSLETPAPAIYAVLEYTVTPQAGAEALGEVTPEPAPPALHSLGSRRPSCRNRSPHFGEEGSCRLHSTGRGQVPVTELPAWWLPGDPKADQGVGWQPKGTVESSQVSDPGSGLAPMWATPMVDP